MASSLADNTMIKAKLYIVFYNMHYVAMSVVVFCFLHHAGSLIIA